MGTTAWWLSPSQCGISSEIKDVLASVGALLHVCGSLSAFINEIPENVIKPSSRKPHCSFLNHMKSFTILYTSFELQSSTSHQKKNTNKPKKAFLVELHSVQKHTFNYTISYRTHTLTKSRACYFFWEGTAQTKVRCFTSITRGTALTGQKSTWKTSWTLQIA